MEPTHQATPSLTTMITSPSADGAAMQKTSYVSSRSANSLISFSRPTRIQAVTLEYLNKTLDELLLLVLASAKSLATDRIKSEGILRVLGGQSGSGSGAGALLAKNAVLEAELELRSYLDGQRKEGGKMPLGLSSSSRLDGTDAFPVQSAYKILRVRCQYYSTLGDMEDPSPRQQQDQNIMSAEGRPIATVTPGVAIYVTALLEFVAEYILQNVARVIERDNSDEASLNDLVKAIEEDEGTSYVWKKMEVRRDIESQLQKSTRGGKVQKPWQVPDADELDLAAGAKKKFNRQSVTVVSSPTESRSNDMDARNGTISPSSSAEHGAMASAAGVASSSVGHGTHHSSNSMSGSANVPVLKRRPSTDRWFLGKRRGSFRSSQDLSGTLLTSSDRAPATSGSILAPSSVNGHGSTGSALDNDEDDFDSLVMSGQTMKVSLTPNRLRSMDSATDEDPKRMNRKRPGTGNTALRPSPGSLTDDRDERRPASRNTLPSSERKPPPSSYRAIEAPTTDARSSSAAPNEDNTTSRGGVDTPIIGDDDRSMTARHRVNGSVSSAMTPGSKGLSREDKRKSLSVRDMVNMIQSNSPPSPMTTDDSFAISGRESRMSLASQASTTDTNSKRRSTRGKVLGLFGRKSSVSSVTPSSHSPSPNPSMHTFTNASEKQRPPLSATFINEDEQGIAIHRDHSVSSVTNEVPSTRESPELVLSTPQETSLERSESRGKLPTPDAAYPTMDDSQDDHMGTPAAPTVGLYQEPRANASNSTLSSVNNHVSRSGDQAVSRKVPWSYSRQQVVNGGRRFSGPMVGAPGKMSSTSSSQGHDTMVGGAPPSAWAQTNLGSGDASHSAAGVATRDGSRTPVHGVSPTFGSGRVSPSLRNGSKSADTARLLVQLNQKMRECNSVDECQRLVTQALAMAAAAVHNEHGPTTPATLAKRSSFSSHDALLNRTNSAASATTAPGATQPPVVAAEGAAAAVGEIPDEIGSQDQIADDRKLAHSQRRGQKSAIELNDKTAKGHVASHLSALPLLRPINYRNVTLPMAIGYDASEDDNLPLFRHQSLVAGWLLDTEGEEPTELDHFEVENFATPNPPPSSWSRAAKAERSRPTSVSSAGQDSDFLSADERPRVNSHSVPTNGQNGAPNVNGASSSSGSDSFNYNNGVTAATATAAAAAAAAASTGRADSSAMKQRRLAYTNSRNAAKQSIMRSAPSNAATAVGSGPSPPSLSASASPNRVPYQLPAAADSTTSTTGMHADEDNMTRRVSTVSSNYSAYRDAEEGVAA